MWLRRRVPPAPGHGQPAKGDTAPPRRSLRGGTGSSGFRSERPRYALDREGIFSQVKHAGHFDNEIDVASLENYPWEEIKPQVDHIIFPDRKRIILLAKGSRVNLACGTGHPSDAVFG
jgi:hypothetical protein